MPTFRYKTLAQENAPSEGTIVAGNRREALQRLIANGQHPLDLQQEAGAQNGKGRGFRFGRKAIRLATINRQLATLSGSGVPIVKSLNVLIEQHKDPKAKQVLTDIREAIQSGSTFAEALGAHPRIFPKLMTSMVAVGERGGTLDTELLELSELYEREESLKGEVLAAVAYPMLVLVAGLVSAVVLLVFFVPMSEFPDLSGVRGTTFGFDLGGQIDGTGSVDTSGVEGPDFGLGSLFAPPPGPPLFTDPPPVFMPPGG